MPTTAARKRRNVAPTLAPSDYGNYNGPVRVRWLADGRFMALCSELVFDQKNGATWMAPVGTRTNGADIPPVFWMVIGGPFEGKYRDAAVVHDYECCVKMHEWQQVHRMFFDAMMASGEARWRALLMYFAVYFFGPRWGAKKTHPDRDFREADAARAAKYFELRPDMSLDDVEALTRQGLRARVKAVPRSVPGANALSDSRRIEPVTRTGACIEPGDCQP